MKKLSLAISLVLLSSVLLAQKVDLDPIYAKVQYRNLPSKPLGFDYKTYSVSVSSGNLNEELYSSDLVKSNIKLEGFKYVTDGADLVIKFRSEDIIITRTEIKTRTDEIKDKSGKVTGRQTLGWFEVDYTFSTVFEVMDLKTNKVLHSSVLDDRNSKYQYKTEESKVINAGSEYYKTNRKMVLAGFVSKKYNEYFSTINARVNNLFGFPVVTETLMFWVLDSKKHPEYQDHQTNLKNLVALLPGISSDLPIDNIKEQAAPIIEYLKGLDGRYKSEEKADKKMRYSGYYNLALLYLYIDMPNEAIEMGNKVIENDYDKGDGKIIIAKAEKLKALFETNNFFTRHFERDLSN
jgi:hypothetical protein